MRSGLFSRSMSKCYKYLPPAALSLLTIVAAVYHWSELSPADKIVLEAESRPGFLIESVESHECSDDVFNPSEDLIREGCVLGFDGERYNLTAFQRGESVERIVFLDTGGPGFKSQAIENRMSSLTLPFLENTLTIALHEGWESFSFNSECSDALDALVDDGRSGKSNSEAAGFIGQYCVPPSRYKASMDALLQAIDNYDSRLPIGIVAASFGAQRLLSLPSETLARVEWVLLDSPFFTGSSIFPIGNLSVAAANAIEHLPDLCGEDCLGIDSWLVLSGEERFELDTETALLALAGSPETNIEYMRSKFVRESGDQKLPSADIAARFLRAKFGITYDNSWFGYWSEICPAFSDWSSSHVRNASSNLERRISSLYQAIHQPCRYYQERKSEVVQTDPALFPRICLVTGTYDPYTLPPTEELLASLSPADRLQREEAGHLPLSYNPALSERISSFVRGEACGDQTASPIASVVEPMENERSATLLDQMLAAEDAVALCMQQQGLEYVPFISQQTLQNLKSLEQQSTPDMYGADPVFRDGSIASFGIATPVLDHSEREAASADPVELLQNPNVNYANHLSEDAREKYYTTLFGESPEQGCAIIAYRDFDDQIRAIEGDSPDEILAQSDEQISEEIYGHADVKSEENAVLRCLSDSGYEFTSVDEVTVDLENRMANWMDNRAEYEMDMQENKPVENQKIQLMAELEQIKNDEVELATVYSSCAETYHAVVTEIAEVVLAQ